MHKVNKEVEHKMQIRTAALPLFRTAKGQVATRLFYNNKGEKAQKYSLAFNIRPQQEESYPLKQLVDSKFSIVSSTKTNTVFSGDILVLFRL